MLTRASASRPCASAAARGWPWSWSDSPEASAPPADVDLGRIGHPDGLSLPGRQLLYLGDGLAALGVGKGGHDAGGHHPVDQPGPVELLIVRHEVLLEGAEQLAGHERRLPPAAAV